MEHQFVLPIGDWSGDGHSQCENFAVASNKDLTAVREAYFKAKKLFPNLCPEGFCYEYASSSLTNEQVEMLLTAGFEQKNFLNERNADGCQDLYPEDMAMIVLWFCKFGDVELQLELLDDLPILQFYGQDKEGRHISSFGYGLFDKF